MLFLAPEPWEDTLLAKLTSSPPNEETMLELFDRVAPELWGYALHRTRRSRAAAPIVIDAILTATRHPAIFADRRVSIRVRMLMLVHLATEDSPTSADISPGRRRLRYLGRRRVPLSA